MRFFLFIKLFRESYLFAINAIIVNKLRTILSLLGITIGIFAIISVFTVFDSLRAKIDTSIKSLGNNAVFIQKWPWEMGGNFAWWKYFNRPVPTLSDMAVIQKRSKSVQYAAFGIKMVRAVKYMNNSVDNAVVIGVSHDYSKVWNLDIGTGRYFTESESNEGKNVAMIGSEIANNLFENQDPLDKSIKVFGRKYNVIAVFNKIGDNMFGNSSDNIVYIPINACRKIMNFNSDFSDPFIIVKAKDNVSIDQVKDEVRGILRSARRLRPSAEDNFSINETSLLIKGFDSLFGIISLAGWIIGGFSILVGGFGIANIMFVSVKERTNMIGIQKSLGAKKYFILLQFLFESVFLSVFGGILGLIFVFTGTQIANNMVDFSFSLTLGNIMLGLMVSAIIGLISGLVPAFIASRLDPVVAIRS